MSSAISIGFFAIFIIARETKRRRFNTLKRLSESHLLTTGTTFYPGQLVRNEHEFGDAKVHTERAKS